MRKLIALIDRTRTVRTWADRSSNWICDLSGAAIAFVHFDGVFRAHAKADQIGWFDGDHIRNRRGQVVLIQPNATVEGLTAPQMKKMPKPPNLRVPVGRPILRWFQRATKPQRVWADYQSLFEDGLAKVRGFELQLRTLPVSNRGRAKSHPQKSVLKF